MNTQKQFLLSLKVAIPLLLCYHLLPAQQGNFCDDLLPVSLIQEVCGEFAADVRVKVNSDVTENMANCSRLYGKGTPSPFKNNLVLQVSPISAKKNARELINAYARGAQQFFYFEYLPQLGDYGVRYLEPDQGSGNTCGVVAFVKNGLLIELKDTNWGDRDLNSFIFSIEQLQTIAEKMAANMTQ